MKSFVFVFQAVLTVDAWNPLAHDVVARVAAARLTAKGKEFVGGALRVPVDQVTEIMAIESVWADLKQHLFPGSGAWHFAGGSDGLELLSGCTAAQGELLCELVKQIHNLLSNEPAVRQNAVKFVIHLMADLHQPLHVGRASDSDGNVIKIKLPDALVPVLDKPGTNLHSLWDAGLPNFCFLKNKDLKPATKREGDGKRVNFPTFTEHEIANQLGEVLAKDSGEIQPLGITAETFTHGTALQSLLTQVATRSHHLSLAHAYAFTDSSGIRVEMRKGAPAYQLPMSYLEENAGLIPHLLAEAGLQLAEVLNVAASLAEPFEPVADPRAQYEDFGFDFR